MNPALASVPVPPSVLAAAAAGVVVAAGSTRLSMRSSSSAARHQLARTHARVHDARASRPPRTIGGRHRIVVLAAGILLLSVVVYGPLAAAGAALAGLLARAFTRRRVSARQRAERDRALPELIDLFLLAASAGLPVATALPVVASRAPMPLRPALARANGRLERGAPLADALQGMREELGSRAVALVDVLGAAARTGSPLVPSLHQVVATARDERTRAAEEAARRLPVSLLFPLACCVLPAAVLLALVPVIASSLSSLAR